MIPALWFSVFGPWPAPLEDRRALTCLCKTNDLVALLIRLCLFPAGEVPRPICPAFAHV